MHGTPREAAGKASDHGLSFVAILAVIQNAERGHVDVNTVDVETYAKAFRERGIDVYVWGYPRAGWEQSFVQSLVRAAGQANAKGLIADPEASYKGKPKDLGTLRDLLEETQYPIIWTSYALHKVHSGFPWGEIAGHGAGSPQIYTISNQAMRRSLRDWQGAGWQYLVPSVPAFGRRAQNDMKGYISAILNEDIQGVIVWHWRHMDRYQWEVLNDLVDMAK